MAAVLACGPDAVLSHRNAAALWGLRPSGHTAVDVTVPGRSRAGQEGITVHNVRTLHPRDRTIVEGIPVTSVHRALLDYAEVAHRNQLGWAFDAADRLGLLDLAQIEAVRARSPGRRGIKPLKAIVAEHRGPAPETRSELERRFLALVREADLPEPSVSVVVAGFTVDFHWPSRGLVAEIDGYRFHRSRRSFEDDRARRQAAARRLAGAAGDGTAAQGPADRDRRGGAPAPCAHCQSGGLSSTRAPAPAGPDPAAASGPRPQPWPDLGLSAGAERSGP